MEILFSFGAGVTPLWGPGTNEGVEVIDDALIEPIELRSLLLVDSSIRADGAEKGETGVPLRWYS